jgi:hypothetical protein
MNKTNYLKFNKLEFIYCFEFSALNLEFEATERSACGTKS